MLEDFAVVVMRSDADQRLDRSTAVGPTTPCDVTTWKAEPFGHRSGSHAASTM